MNYDGIYDWQLMNDNEINVLLAIIKENLNNILNTSIDTLGKQKWIWKNCVCSRKHCDNCWVEKNLWEAKN